MKYEDCPKSNGQLISTQKYFFKEIEAFSSFKQIFLNAVVFSSLEHFIIGYVILISSLQGGAENTFLKNSNLYSSSQTLSILQYD